MDNENVKLYQPGTQNVRAQMQNAENNVNAQAMEYRTVYPEVYYKLQPYIMMVCDQMDTYGTTMPSQEMIERMFDNIYDDLCALYPDIADFV